MRKGVPEFAQRSKIMIVSRTEIVDTGIPAVVVVRHAKRCSDTGIPSGIPLSVLEVFP